MTIDELNEEIRIWMPNDEVYVRRLVALGLMEKVITEEEARVATHNLNVYYENHVVTEKPQEFDTHVSTELVGKIGFSKAKVLMNLINQDTYKNIFKPDVCKIIGNFTNNFKELDYFNLIKELQDMDLLTMSRGWVTINYKAVKELVGE